MALAEADPLSLDELLKLDDPVLEKRLTDGNPAYTDKRFEDFQSRLPYIAEELADKKRTHVTRHLLWEEYKQDNPNGYGYTQFCFHVSQYVDAQKPSFVMKQDRPGGEYLYIDFAGDTLSYTDPITNENIECHLFVAILPTSDYPFFKAVRSQKIEDFLDGLRSALEFFGGVPKILVPDNLKSAVVKSDRYQPEINTILEDFANHYGCVTIPARAYKPKDKSNAEGSVCRAYRHIYAPLRHEQFFSLEDLNNSISKLQKYFVQKRMQQIPFTREERFIALDKPNLKPLISEPFEIRIRVELKVQPNSYIYLGRDKSYYSVPYKYIGKKVKVEYTPTIVAIYAEGAKVAIHPRSLTYGKYVTISSHLPSYYENYVNLSPEKYIDRALAVSEKLAEVMVNIFTTHSSVPPETYYKSCDGLFHLQKTTPTDLFDRACEIALMVNQCKYSYILNLVRTKCSGFDSYNGDSVVFPDDTHDNIRGPQYYAKL